MTGDGGVSLIWTLSSVEVRWFYQGAIPAETSAWFERSETEFAAMPSRVDHYVRLLNDASLGIKLREGRVEIKQRQQEFGIIQLAEQVAGRVEGWRKWSFALAQRDDELSAMLEPTPSWVAVHKQRRLRKYGLSGNRQIQAIPVSELPSQRCSLELTAINVAGQGWWSLALEAVGDEEEPEEILLRVARHTLQDRTVSIFDAQHSYSYPEWLAQHPWST
jgi:hypothetical protein